ncbi:MAG: hypothetical protein JWO72_1617 [Caulobacteraceae bacterium]|nr:hypothetical protein [Caulobacteraceae bacterium]
MDGTAGARSFGRRLAAPAKALLKRHPSLWFAIRGAYRAVRGRAEPELALLRHLVDPARRAIDVGANVGSYSHRLSRLCLETIAVEANPDLATELRRMLPANVKVVHAAASDREGEVVLRIPEAGAVSTGLGTIEAANTLGGGRERTVAVPALRLADLGVQDVGFIKIDVEGHELAVLKGALPLIASCRPAILVEAEERHRPGAVASIADLLQSLGYEGFMLGRDRAPVTIRSFELAAHQALKPSDLAALDGGHAPPGYVSNFFFVPRERAAPWMAWSDGRARRFQKGAVAG